MPNQPATNHLGPNGECDECGQPHLRYGRPACAGHVRFDRDPQSPTYRQRLDQPRPCCNPPRPGLERCWQHGAGAKRSTDASRRHTDEAKAEQAMRRFGGPIDTTPTEALLDAVRWTAGYVAWLREQIDEHADDETQDSHISEAVATKLAEWTDLLRKVCTDAIRCGIEERRVRFAESQGQQVAEAIKGILADLDLTADQLARVGEVVPLHLRRLMHVA
jgi:hypothetical protein